MSISEKTLDEQECLAIFNRAVEYNDTIAWQTLHERFSGMMRYWLRQSLAQDCWYGVESEENYIALAFERFWYAASHKKHIHFATLAAALDYLRASLRSVAIDIIRTQKRNAAFPIQHSDASEVLVEESYEEASELWEEIKKVLPDEREQRAANLLFNCNLKPRQIVQLRPQEFSDVQELYRVRRKVFERCIQNADSLRWRLQG